MTAATIVRRVIRHFILLGGSMVESRDVGCVQATVPRQMEVIDGCLMSCQMVEQLFCSR
jgi:hypothetical protein